MSGFVRIARSFLPSALMYSMSSERPQTYWDCCGLASLTLVRFSKFGPAVHRFGNSSKRDAVRMNGPSAFFGLSSEAPRRPARRRPALRLPAGLARRLSTMTSRAGSP